VRAHRPNYLCRGGDEAVLERPDRGRGTAPHADLLVDVLNVVPDSPGRDAEAVGDRLVRLAADEDREHLELALGEAAGDLARALRRTMPRRGEHCVDRARLEPA